ncbi:hypothetical protein MHBO_002527 [Bonamia ostreae]|uniref:Asparagine synthetase domain-containing protein n=1 Tax=Bonamia ostreae TaxID=126728 RepID=A0ABV2ANG3_9EUKA
MENIFMKKLNFFTLKNFVVAPELTCPKNFLEDKIKILTNLLKNELKKITKFLDDKKSIALLFSGGLDSIIGQLSSNVFIDLINVSFFKKQNIEEKNGCHINIEAPDRITSINGLIELKSLFPLIKWRLICIDVTEKMVSQKKELIKKLVFPKNDKMSLNIATVLFFAVNSVGNNNSFIVTNTPKKYLASKTCRYGVHFKKIVPKDRNIKNQFLGQSEVNLSGFGDIKKHTEIWKEIDFVKIGNEDICPEVFISGLGPDEYLGGYLRHRNIFENTKNKNLLKNEIDKDIDLLWSRNLGFRTKYLLT